MERGKDNQYAAQEQPQEIVGSAVLTEVPQLEVKPADMEYINNQSEHGTRDRKVSYFSLFFTTMLAYLQMFVEDPKYEKLSKVCTLFLPYNSTTVCST